jgi:hypothetical protein
LYCIESINNNTIGTTNVELSGLEMKELKFRKEFGLDKDIRKIQQDRNIGKYGVSLSLDEEKELIERFDFQDKTIPLIKEKLKKIVNEDYTIYIDQENGGIINVGLKSIKQDLTEIENLFPDKSKLKFKVVKFSESELERIHENIWNKKDYLEMRLRML